MLLILKFREIWIYCRIITGLETKINFGRLVLSFAKLLLFQVITWNEMTKETKEKLYLSAGNCRYFAKFDKSETYGST